MPKHITMFFTDIPTAVAVGMYNRAIGLYARSVERRATAIYRVGSINYPGLSDIDLLVVATSVHRDNNQYFSVFDRLPARFHDLFLHQPFILPARALAAFGHAKHARPVLIAGDDVLKGSQPIATRDELWCRLLEQVCNVESYLSRCRERTSLPARHTIAVASSLRFALQDYDKLFSTDSAPRFEREVDERRAALLAGISDGQRLVAEIFATMSASAQALAERLRVLLPSAAGATLGQACKQILQGGLAFDALPSDRLAARRQRIDLYHAELRRLRFTYGHLFFGAAYDEVSNPYRQTSLERRLFSRYYRMRNAAIVA